MSRRKIIAGNWKMNQTPSQALELVETLKPLVADADVDVVYCVPAVDIVPVVEAVKGTNVKVGAENMYIEEKGAYTGEIAPAMLVDAGASYVIIGHSERRDYFAGDVARIVIAYEPIWAIGTGRTATSDQAEEVCAAIRQTIAEIYDQDTADKIRIQYGGSMKAANCKELLAKPNIDGGLIGGASLTEEFASIVNYNK